jgi:hypothetical protein
MRIIIKSGYFCFLFFTYTISLIGQQKKESVNLIENFRESGIPVTTFDEKPLASLIGENYAFAAISKDHKNIAIARSYSKGENDVKDIILVNLKNEKQVVLMDTQSMFRYGRPHGFLWSMEFNDQDQLVAYIGDGAEKTSVLTFDIEKRIVIKDTYIDNYENEDGDYEEDTMFLAKMADLRKLFPQKTDEKLSEFAYKLKSIDTIGYVLQGISPRDNNIYFLSHGTIRLKLLHNVVDKSQFDNIDGVWGNSNMFFYLLKDKKNDYLFQFNIQTNIITLLKKLPVHAHYSYIYSKKLNNGDFLLYFEAESGQPGLDEVVKLFKFNNGSLKEITEYPLLQEIQLFNQQDLILLYYIQGGKRCLDIRKLQ